MVLPGVESVPDFLTVGRGTLMMPSYTEVLGNRTIGGEEPLSVPWRLASLHAALPLVHGLMGVFRTLVEIAVLPMFYAWEELPRGCPTAVQLIGDEHPGDLLAAFDQLAEDFPGSCFIPPTLHQNIRRCQRQNRPHAWFPG
jgi:hypothetical protein